MGGGAYARLWAWFGGGAVETAGVVTAFVGVVTSKGGRGHPSWGRGYPRGGGRGVALPYMAGATQMGHMASLGGWGLGAWSVRPRPPS